MTNPRRLIIVMVCVGIVSGCSKELSWPDAQSSGAAYRVSAKSLNCRALAKARTRVVDRLQRNEAVNILETRGSWGRVHREVGDCWLALSRLARDDGPDAAATAAQPAPPAAPAGEVRIPLRDEAGTFVARGTINDATTLNFTVDSGSADVTIPQDVFSRLVRAGAVSQDDVLGFENYRDADGSNHRLRQFRIRSLKVGAVEVRDVQGSIAQPGAPALLGQTFLKRFRSWSLENSRHELILNGA